MAKRENPNDVPKKFRKLKRTFLEHLQENNNGFFQSFPKGLSFYGKEKAENVVLVVRSHWVIYFPYIFSALVILLLPFIIHSITDKNTLFLIAMLIASVTVSLTIFIYIFVRWFYNVNIITDRRVIDLDFHSVVSHSLAEARLDKIEDVTHKQDGVIGSIFDMGTVYIQTAGATAEIEFDHIPRPRDVQDILYDLLESKQKGEI